MKYTRDRQASSNTSTTLSITDRNGADITSSFQIMLYSGSPPGNASSSGLQDRQLGRVRYINECPQWDSFKESKCDVWRNRIGSLQSWTKTCLRFSTQYGQDGVPISSSLQPIYRDGHCEIDEVCVNSFGPLLGGKKRPTIATCIAKSEFGPTFDRQKTGLKRILDAVLDSIRGTGSPPKQSKVDSSGSPGESGRSSSAAFTVSKADGQTPIEAKTLEFTAWNNADGQSGEAEKQRNKKCRMCSDLEVAKVGSNPDHLDLEVSLLTAGTVAGVLWIAVMSG